MVALAVYQLITDYGENSDEAQVHEPSEFVVWEYTHFDSTPRGASQARL